MRLTFKDKTGKMTTYETNEVFRQNENVYFYTTKGEYILRPASELVKEKAKKKTSK